MSWKELKDLTFEFLDQFLREPRQRYETLMSDKAQIQRILLDGAARARPEAVDLIGRVRTAIGREDYSRHR